MRITVTAARSVPAPLGQRGRGPQACGVGSSPAPALPSPRWLFQMKCLTGSGDVWSRDANEASLDTEPGKRYLHWGNLLRFSQENQSKAAGAALAGARFCWGVGMAMGEDLGLWPLGNPGSKGHWATQGPKATGQPCIPSKGTALLGRVT